MKKSVITIVLLSALVTLHSCKSNKKQEEPASQATTTEPAPDASTANSAAADTKTYAVTATPDTVVLGKNREAFIRLKDLKAINLSNPDGQATGMEFTYKIELTNRNPIGGNSVGLPTTNFRLQLDNGNKLSPNSVYVSADAEATKLSDDDKFTIPAGAKPTALILFYDQTTATVKLELQ